MNPGDVVAIVVHDDGRSHGIEDAVSAWSSLSVPVVVVGPRAVSSASEHVPLSGPVDAAQARNLGAERTGRPYVAFVDATCRPMPTWFDAIGDALAVDRPPGVLVGPVDHPPFTSSSVSKTVLGPEIGPPERNMVVRRDSFLSVDGFRSGRGPGAGVDLLWRLDAEGVHSRRMPTMRCVDERPLRERAADRYRWVRQIRTVNDAHSARLPQSDYLKNLLREQLPEVRWSQTVRAARFGAGGLRHGALGRLQMGADGVVDWLSAGVGDAVALSQRRWPGVLTAPDWRASNPYQRLFYEGLTRAGFEVMGVRHVRPGTLLKRRSECRILHLHWILGICALDEPDVVRKVKERLQWVRRLDYRLVWTVHNEQTHDTDRPDIDRTIRALLADHADLIIVHSQAFRARFLREYGVDEDKVLHMAHGTFAGAYRAAPTPSDSLRSRLGIPVDAPCALHVGQIRPYKGLEDFIPVWRATAGADWRLVLAGQCKPIELGARLRALAEGDDRIHFVFERIPDDDLRAYLAMSDLVVLPYRRILTSGSALLASSFGRRIIAPRIGVLPETYDDFPELAALYDPAAGPQDALRHWGGQRATDADAQTLAAFERFHTRYAWSRLSGPVIERFRTLVA